MLANAGFPTGSMHLKTFRLKDSSFFDLFASPEKTKPPTLEAIVKRFPGRRFILFGDAGEKDPEVYGDLARARPDQIIAIAIRVPHADDHNARRFENAFREIDQDMWTSFTDVQDLEAFIEGILSEQD